MTARAAVPISTNNTCPVDIKPSNKAPNGGAKMLMIPCKVWFMPATRARCLFGTMRDVDEVIAGLWNAPPSERAINMM
jgi:hypothetical protein